MTDDIVNLTSIARGKGNSHYIALNSIPTAFDLAQIHKCLCQKR